MSSVSREEVIEQLRRVNDPELHKNIVTLNMVKNVITIGAGKGGIGKSTAAVLLAYGLHRTDAVHRVVE